MASNRSKKWPIENASVFVLVILSLISVLGNLLFKDPKLPFDLKNIFSELFGSLVIGFALDIIIKFNKFNNYFRDNTVKLDDLDKNIQLHSKELNILIKDVNDLRDIYKRISSTLLNHVQNNADLLRIACLPITTNPGEQALIVWYDILHRIDGSFLASSNIHPSAYKNSTNEDYYKTALTIQQLKRTRNRKFYIQRIFFAYEDSDLNDLKTIIAENETHKIDVKCVNYDQISSRTSHQVVNDFIKKCEDGIHTLDFIVVLADYKKFVIAFRLSQDRKGVEDVRYEFSDSIVQEYIKFHEYVMCPNVIDDRKIP
jgi:hypothetical protein